MAWKENPIGIVVDATMRVDLAKAKAFGISFVVCHVGTGKEEPDHGWEGIADQAKVVGLPLIAVHTPLPAMDDVTKTACPTEQLPALQRWLGTKQYQALVVRVTRWWVDHDLENNRTPPRITPPGNIRYTAEEIVRTMHNKIAPLNRKVLVGSNDTFASQYCPELASWTDAFGFYLIDNRYRLPAMDGSYTRYITYGSAPVLKETIEALRLSLPPVESKNPLVPGSAPQLKFWEATGTRFAFPFITDHAGGIKGVPVVLFNGSYSALTTLLNWQPPTTTPPGGQPGEQPDPVLQLAEQVRILADTALEATLLIGELTTRVEKLEAYKAYLEGLTFRQPEA